eukprot:2385116-Rhodomonas_salina.1
MRCGSGQRVACAAVLTEDEVRIRPTCRGGTPTSSLRRTASAVALRGNAAVHGGSGAVYGGSAAMYGGSAAVYAGDTAICADDTAVYGGRADVQGRRTTRRAGASSTGRCGLRLGSRV